MMEKISKGNIRLIEGKIMANNTAYSVDQKQTTLSREILLENLTDVFVETGTNTGFGTQLALECGFKKIVTIDIEKKYVDNAKEKFKNNPNVECLLGDSRDLLPNVISKNVGKRITFWLDGHGGLGDIPLIEELRSIATSDIKNHIILIDDVRMIDSNMWKNFGFYNSLDDIKKELLEINQNYTIRFLDSISGKGDILLAKIID